MKTSMTAYYFAETYGESAIDMVIDTPALGEYPGGLARVTGVFEDPEASEIPIQVEHPTFGTIGVFGYEIIEVEIDG